PEPARASAGRARPGTWWWPGSGGRAALRPGSSRSDATIIRATLAIATPRFDPTDVRTPLLHGRPCDAVTNHRADHDRMGPNAKGCENGHKAGGIGRSAADQWPASSQVRPTPIQTSSGTRRL